MEIALGTKVKCKITGFTGIATAKVEYINGCKQYAVRGPVGKDGKMPEVEYIDHEQLEVIGKGVTIKPNPTGGPQRDCPKH